MPTIPQIQQSDRNQENRLKAVIEVRKQWSATEEIKVVQVSTYDTLRIITNIFVMKIQFPPVLVSFALILLLTGQWTAHKDITQSVH